MTAARALASALLVALVMSHAPASGADAPSAVGWWWSGNIEGLPVQPPPPDVPEGGLYVASGLSGASGVSALRFAVPAGAREPVLTLRVAAASGTLVIGACPAATAWEPAAGGPFDARPEPDCERASVAGEVSADGTTVRIALGALLDGTALDVVVLPGLDPTTGVGATFDAELEPPGADALTFAEPPPIAAQPSPPATVSSGSPPTTSFTAPPAVAQPPAAAPTPVAFTPADNSSPATADPATVSTPASGARPIASTTPSDTDGRVAGVLLAAIVAATWFLLTRTGLGARLAATTGGSDDVVRGIGRSALPRDSKPPTL